MMRQNLTAGFNHYYITESEIVNNHKNSIFVFLLSLIAVSLLSLSVLATMASAQTPSTSGANSTTSNETGVKQMGICVVGAGGPCNGDSKMAK